MKGLILLLVVLSTGRAMSSVEDFQKLIEENSKAQRELAAATLQVTPASDQLKTAPYLRPASQEINTAQIKLSLVSKSGP
jgi:hypothetical protein